MARINGYGITGSELQAMVNENILLAKGSIPATNRCLTNAEVYSGTYVYLGDAPSGTFLPLHDLGGGTIGVSPNWLANFTNINPIGSQSVLFELDQSGSPYLNADLFAQVNGSPLRLDPSNNLDGLFFGGPQWSPQMNQYVKVGNSVTVQGNYGRDDQETPGNWGWNGGGYGVLEIWVNDVLINQQTTGYRQPAYAPNLTSLTYSFIVQPNTDYRVYAYTVQSIPDNILDCGNQSTVYIGPYPETFTTDFYVGPGPAIVQLRPLYARKFYSPGQYPTSGTSQVSGSTNAWWFGHLLTGDILHERGGSYYAGGAYPNLVPSTQVDTVEGWSFIPQGQDTITLNLYAGSPDSIFEISSYVGCSIPGTNYTLHWSPDTVANACDSNYSYHYFDGSEMTIDGFTGYRQYFVTGGFQVGGRISAYPTGTTVIPPNVSYGTGGKLVYTYPNYADSIPDVTNSAGTSYNQVNVWGGAMTSIHKFANPGYYSDGTNWALVGDSRATTGYNNGVIIEVGSCATCKRYAITDYFLPA